jgi:hypothetical protein
MMEARTNPAASPYHEKEKTGQLTATPPGAVEGAYASFMAASAGTRAMMFSVLLIAGGSLFWIVTKGGNAAALEEEEHQESEKRVRFEMAEERNEEREHLVAQQMAENERRQQVAQIEHFLDRLKAVSDEISKVETELKQTGGSLDTLTGDDKVSYDTNLSDFESEQSIEKAFMTKDDIDKKRNGMVHLAEELDMHRKFLVGKYNETVAAVKQMGNQYQQVYGHAPPVTRTATASPQTPRMPPAANPSPQAQQAL